MDHAPRILAGQIRRVINRLIFLEKRSVFQHQGVRLHPSEIHLMQVLREWPDLNAGGMAQKLGISNGAVSQTLARLEKKGVLKKSKDPSLKNRVTAVFTAEGKEAIQRFEEQQASSVKAFSIYLAGLSEGEREAIGSFLSKVEEFLKSLG
ncbi:MAG: MarR family winged helix-turn-helix transcriptional regulator [Thermodesulfobacteriota bacterium]